MQPLKQNPLVFSVIIPALNEEDCIGRCLDSINRSEWPSSQVQVLVVDNGSTDTTARIAREKGAQVLVFPGLSIASLRNWGARKSGGSILAFLDADCSVPSNWLTEASRYIDQTNVVCFGSPPVLPENPTWVQNAWMTVRQKSEPVGDVKWLESMNMFIRREAFDTVGGFAENLQTCEDYDLSIRLGALGRIVSDSRIRAVHHGEASTPIQFWRKELWRGISNYRGVLDHGVQLGELPSLVFPLAYLLILAFLCAALVISAHSSLRWILWGSSALYALLQITLLLAAAYRARKHYSIKLALQLYVLLNLYYLARGSAPFCSLFR